MIHTRFGDDDNKKTKQLMERDDRHHIAPPGQVRRERASHKNPGHGHYRCEPDAQGHMAEQPPKIRNEQGGDYDERIRDSVATESLRK
ncbi:MAG: hypothetical protein L0Z50_00170 [Verrucomicrobiales bacterium]|nr:hypothetical protein [Verrucomicrobiales bacterium]